MSTPPRHPACPAISPSPEGLIPLFTGNKSGAQRGEPFCLALYSWGVAGFELFPYSAWSLHPSPLHSQEC